MALPFVQGKTAIVTGSGAGINLSFAKLLLSKGCNVVFADLALRPEAKEVVDAHQSGSPRAVSQQTDVTEWSQLERMFEVADKEFGSVDIVCPGAGVYEPAWSNFWVPPGTGTSKDSPTSNRYTAMDINVTHPIRTTQLAIAHFLKHKRSGSIVHIASIAAQLPTILVPLYVASKFAISGFVRSLKQLETSIDPTVPSIRVTAVAPGVVKTPLWLDNPDKLKWVDESKDEWVTPEEVAERMLDLITREDYVGGTVLEVGKNQARTVEVLHDPGPSGPGMTVSNREDARAEVWDKLAVEGWGQASKD
ncbi:hypothetical protein OHC33_004559 [Knufia fluminis]|uniref:Uncharacterized protein n=1 Tax=Knufia fluminis TaxID=191047 RepID=A0AAN8EMP3_9EURO|nr:hypothetical protein OHC33_004559 [Knufia fluminis]